MRGWHGTGNVLVTFIISQNHIRVLQRGSRREWIWGRQLAVPATVKKTYQHVEKPDPDREIETLRRQRWTVPQRSLRRSR